ncbi:hypothetical protein LX59_02687 [Azomonas agilis]|uniref:NADH:ubiquinone oxidoreductase n=1 Tax=Azomonas agilis TaxID=116849 RepID=A0A562HZU2_9GAMM|nr:NADH:ubiquinone oxidoreductase [Azomonas agilis]TWH64280.1 hypothetical protein LX59_02687 [Azomonas agilis]
MFGLRLLGLLIGLGVCTQVQAEACAVYSAKAEEPLIRCQQNRSIPPHLFRSGFCVAQPEGHHVNSKLMAQCPLGFQAACRNAQVGNTTYRQDVFYYANQIPAHVQQDCKRRRGVWMR